MTMDTVKIASDTPDVKQPYLDLGVKDEEYATRNNCSCPND